MKKRAKRYHFTVGAVLMTAAIMILTGTACGKEDYPDTQWGIDGYVYASKVLRRSVLEQTADQNYVPGTSINQYDSFYVSGDYLYYCSTTYLDSDFRRLLLSPGREPEFEKGERLFRFSGRSVSLPEKTAGLGEETEIRDLLKSAGREEEGAEGTVVIPGGCTQYYFFLQEYAVDTEQNMYFLERLYTGTEEEMEDNGVLLSRYSPEGKVLWQKYLPYRIVNRRQLAADREGNLFVLTEKELFVYDRDGRRIDTKDMSGYQGREGGGILIQADGWVYLCVRQEGLGTFWKGFYEIQQDHTLQEIKILSGNNYDDTFGTPGGNILLVHRNDGCVYEYDRESGLVQKLLRWEDSNLIRENVWELVRTEKDTLLANHYGTIYLLKKTPVEELPKKEIIVLASLSPHNDLRKAVIEFNRSNTEYHVMIEEYGAGEDRSAAETRLDGKLVSSGPPDLLDMAGLDVYKYAGQEILEDLNVWLEESAVLNREVFLENVLEGYTIDGKLLCIPRQYVGTCIAGRASQLGNRREWSMEDVYELTEQYPESKLLWYRDGKYLLERFCAPYYLKEFVDWETGSCRFDSRDFCRFLEWTAKYQWGGAETGDSVPEDVLLKDMGLRFVDPWSDEIRFGEEIWLTGFPDGGEGVFLYRASDEIGIVSRGLRKEGSWKFLEYYLSRPWDDIWSSGNTTRRDFLQELAEKAGRSSRFVYDSDGERMKDMNGDYIILEPTLFTTRDGELIGYEQTPQRLIDRLVTMIEKIDFTPRPQEEKEIIKIVMEEAATFYNGDKTSQEAAEVIQNRVQLLLKERR